MVKLAAFCRGGYSTKVFRKSPTIAWAGMNKKIWSITQSQYVFEVISARSYGSVRRLKSFGKRNDTRGSCQIRKVPGIRCSMKVTFQLSYLIAIRSPSSEK